MRSTRAAAIAVAAAASLVGLPALGYGAGGTTLKLHASTTKLAFNTKRLVVAKPGKVTLLMSNPSPLMHNIAVKGGGLKRPVKGKIVGKGKTSSVTISLKKGTYTFYCSVDGHAKAGMKGVLIVR